MLIYVAIFGLCMQTLHIIAFKFRKVVAR
jgi:hypothetical protein